MCGATDTFACLDPPGEFVALHANEFGRPRSESPKYGADAAWAALAVRGVFAACATADGRNGNAPI